MNFTRSPILLTLLAIAPAAVAKDGLKIYT